MADDNKTLGTQLGLDSDPVAAPKASFLMRLRNYFLTGMVVVAPVAITVYLAIGFVDFVDGYVGDLLPERYNPAIYLPFPVPGLGLIAVFVSLTLIGALTANFLGRSMIGWGKSLVGRMPVIRSIYNVLKQIFETVVSQSGDSFSQVGLIEYPRKGLYAIVFITGETMGEVRARGGRELVNVFLPTTPNPTSGFLLMVPREDLTVLDMSVEEGAKMIISAGMITPQWTKDPNAQPALPGLEVEKSAD